MNSVSKSFNATAVELAIHDGKLHLDDSVLSFYPSDAPPNPSSNLRAMKVRDLLTMSGGHQTEPDRTGGPSVKQSLGGYGLWLRTEDMAKFGQLYLQQGRWVTSKWFRVTGFGKRCRNRSPLSAKVIPE